MARALNCLPPMCLMFSLWTPERNESLGLLMRKTIYLNLSPFTSTLLHLYVSARTVYIKLSILFSLHLKMMTCSHRNIV